MLIACAGCGTTTARSPFDGSGGGPAGDEIRIEVQNLNFNDATVYAMRQGQRIRLGRVTGKTDQTFRINWNVAQAISFRVDVVSGRSCSTQRVLVEPDSRVWVSIPTNMGYGECRAGRR